MDIAGEPVLHAKRAGDSDELLHGVVGAANDPRAEEQPFDVIAAVKLERERHDLVGRKARATDTARLAINAITAIVNAVIS